MRDEAEFEDVLVRLIGPLDGMLIADIGAGSGTVSRALALKGARVLAVEPNAAAIAAGGKIDNVEFVQASGTKTLLPDHHVDATVFTKSLHHISEMEQALSEAVRITKPNGSIVVYEPEMGDPTWEVVRWIDDESTVLSQAQEAIDKHPAVGRSQTVHYFVKYRVASADAIVRHMIDVDPNRRVSEQAHANVETAYKKYVEHDALGAYLVHYERLDLLSL